MLWVSLVEEYKCAIARPDMTLRESRDPIIRATATTVTAGRKRDIVGIVQHGRGGLGLVYKTHKLEKRYTKGMPATGGGGSTTSGVSSWVCQSSHAS